MHFQQQPGFQRAAKPCPDFFPLRYEQLPKTVRSGPMEPVVLEWLLGWFESRLRRAGSIPRCNKKIASDSGSGTSATQDRKDTWQHKRLLKSDTAVLLMVHTLRPALSASVRMFDRVLSFFLASPPQYSLFGVFLRADSLSAPVENLLEFRSTSVKSALAWSSSSRISEVHQREHETMPPSTENLPESGSLAHCGCAADKRL